MNRIDWEQQRAFLAVLEEGSLSAAARRLGLAQPTVRARIEALEAALGTPLFTRAPSGLLPTERAEALRESARAMALASDAFVRTASAEPGAVAGTVRITASDVIAVEVLPPILAALTAAHPRLAIELSASNRNEDMLRRESDIAVRMVRPAQEALVARRVGAARLGLHAHSDYLAGRSAPRTLEALRGHCLIGPASDGPILQAVQRLGFDFTLPDFAFRSDSDLAYLAAIRAGAGIGICQVPLGHRYGFTRLVESFAFDLETWVVCHEDLRAVPRVRVVFDALVAGLRDYLD